MCNIFCRKCRKDSCAGVWFNLFIGFVFRKTKHPILYICIVSILSLSLLGTLNDLFYYLSYGIVRESSRGGLQFIVNEFAFPYLNLLNIMEINAIYGLRWGLILFPGL